MPECLVIAQTVTQGLLERAHRRKQPVVRSTSPPYPPEALDHLELGTGAGQPVQLQVWHLGEHRSDHGAFVPRGVVDHQHHCGGLRRRISARDIAQVALPRYRLLPWGMGPAPLHDACGQVPRHQVEGPEARDRIVAIQVAHQGAMPLAPQSCPQCRDHREARFILTQQDEFPRFGFFLTPVDPAGPFAARPSRLCEGETSDARAARLGGPKGPHRASADRNAVSLVQRCGQFRLGPVSSVQATAGRTLCDPGQERRGQRLGETAGTTRHPLELEPRQACMVIGMKPALNRAHADAQVFGDVAMGRWRRPRSAIGMA
jgi:hypothetical protein